MNNFEKIKSLDVGGMVCFIRNLTNDEYVCSYCNDEECGMNKPDWNGEVYGCNAGFDDNVSGCSCALANNLLRKLDIQEVE